jgi:hypothetical protein
LSLKIHELKVKNKKNEIPKITQNTSIDPRNEQKEELVERLDYCLA